MSGLDKIIAAKAMAVAIAQQTTRPTCADDLIEIAHRSGDVLDRAMHRVSQSSSHHAAGAMAVLQLALDRLDEQHEEHHPSFAERLRRRHAGAGAVGDEFGVPLIRFETDLGAIAVSNEWSSLTGLDRVASCGDGWLAALWDDDRVPAAALIADVLHEGGAASTTWELAGGNRWVAATICGGPGTIRRTCTMALVEQRLLENLGSDRHHG